METKKILSIVKKLSTESLKKLDGASKSDEKY